ncbi:MAG: hypothetical protein JSR85_05665 [Proteobacteria bacterium]|nr:hypothetical protein [Pseudomonadota bacterium]
MNFTVISLLSLLSFTSLITSPAMCMSSDDKDTSSSHSSPIHSPRAASPTAEQNELDILLSTQNYSGAFASLRKDLPLTCPDEEIVKFLLSSNGYSKYDSLSVVEKKWVANRIATKEVDIVDTTPKSSATPAPTKAAKAPLDAGTMAEIAGYAPVLSNIGDLTEARKSRSQAATKAGVTRELADHLNHMRALLPNMITLDPTLTINNFKEAETFVGHHSKLNAFATATAGAKTTLPNGVKPSELLIEAATLIQNIVEQNPGDVDARTLHATFRTILIDQGDCQLPALSGRLAYVYDLAFNYLVEKYNAD